MLIELESAFYNLTGPDLDLHGDKIESILIAHSMGSHLFAPTPREVVKLESISGLGITARRMLGLIGKRASEYAIARRSVVRKIVIELPGSGRFLDFVGHEIRIDISRLRAEWLFSQPRLFVENASNDGRLYDALISEFLRAADQSVTCFSVNPMHGGGTTLGAVVIGEKLRGPKGLCLSDRDTWRVGPPYQQMAKRLSEELIGSNLIIAAMPEFESRVPVFEWRLTKTRMLENMIGPNLLDVYFQHCPPDGRAARQTFEAAFTQFPILNPDEFVIWTIADFKRGPFDLDDLKAGFLERTGRRVPWPDNRLLLMGAPTVPPASIAWIAHERDGRHTHEIAAAIQEDLKSAIYASMLEDIASVARDLLAADRFIKTA